MQGVYEAGLAINCIANIVTEELARDLLPEVTNLTRHPQPYLRKKAILCLFKLFVKYPQALRLSFDKIKACLTDHDPSVVSCAVNVITELSDKNPKNYLPLAPAFFELLTGSSNNWMLIKVVKLLGSLVPEEPRLARKLLDPLANIVRSTQAKSLLFEAVHTITLCLPYCRKSDGTMPANVPDIVVLCARTLRDFVEQADQNLKYLGLVGFGTLMQSHPRVLSAPDYRPLILTCLSDQDVTIRSRALDLLSGMISRKNLMELVGQLMKHVELATGTYKHDLVAKIIEMCSADKYAMMPDFKWYLDTLLHLGHMRGIEPHGELLRAQVTDVALRVLPVRTYAVMRSIQVLLEGDGRISDDPYGDNGRGKHIMPHILPALAWTIGEYSDLIREVIDEIDEKDDLLLDDDSLGCYHSIIQAFVSPARSLKLSAETQSAYVQAAAKVLAAASADKKVKSNELDACIKAIYEGFSFFAQSTNVDVLERSFTALEMLRALRVRPDTTGYGIGLASEEDGSLADDDLLGMNGGVSQPSRVAVAKNVVCQTRDVSVILSFLLKPSPMKPIGAKVQKKKQESILVVDSFDFSIFHEMIEDELSYLGKSRFNPDSISFTHLQRPRDKATPKELNCLTAPVQLNPTLNDTSMGSFQNPQTTLNAPKKGGDPFYLDSVLTNSNEGDERETNRLVAIQLDDSDNDSEVRKKVKKKEKKSRKVQDFNMLLNATTPQGMLGIHQPVQVYDSDEGEEILNGSGMAGKKPRSRNKGHTKEFAGLAQVDLTAPLRDDEVMPERKHRIVPDRSVTSDVQISKPAKEKKSKKEKRSRKARTTESALEPVGDLLDLGGTGSLYNITQTSNVPVAISQSNSNPISSAFSDLLGLDMPSVEMDSHKQLSPSFAPIGPSLANPELWESEFWMKGKLKTTSSSSSVDWSKVNLKYKLAFRPEGLMMSFAVANESSTMISDLSVSCKIHTMPLHIGTVPIGGTRESPSIGPLALSASNESQIISGSIISNTESISFKLTLPVSVFLVPDEGLSLDTVAEEVSNKSWVSYSAKVEFPSNFSADEVKRRIRAFIRGREVGFDAACPTLGTFACSSRSGAKVRVLLKVKDHTAKVDVKSTSDLLAHSIASDLKRLLVQ